MNHTPNILLFSLFVGGIFIALDVYVLSHWMKYVRKQGLNPWWYRATWLLSVVFLGLFMWLSARRHIFRIDGLDAILFGFTTFWYLPKLPTTVVLLVRDTIKFFGFVIKRMKRLFVTPSQESHVAPVPFETSRRAFIGNATWSLAAVPYIMVGNGMLSTLYNFNTHSEEIILPNLPRALDGLHIVHISDIHAGSFFDSSPFAEAMRIVHGLKPDLIVITGDFVNAVPDELSIVARELNKLTAPQGVYGILGNHDHYNSPAQHTRIIRSLRQMGIDLLINEHRRIGVSGSSLVLAGIDNTGFRQQFGKLHKALDNVADDDAIVLMAHDPTFWDAQVVGKTNIGLTLSGHTHGGQFGVQALGFEWSPAQYVYKQWAGLYRTGDQQIYVNRGLGTVGPPIRIGIPPEITSITLRAPSLRDRLT